MILNLYLILNSYNLPLFILPWLHCSYIQSSTALQKHWPYIQFVDYLEFGKLICLESFRESNSLPDIIKYQLLMRDNYCFKQCFNVSFFFSVAVVLFFGMCLSKYQYLFFFSTVKLICVQWYTLNFKFY